MRIAFVDFGELDYTPLTPLERPLGGTESAACYLTAALAARGHQVALVNATQTPGNVRGVECVSWRQASVGDYLNRLDVLVSITCSPKRLSQIGVTRPIVLWSGHDIDQPGVKSLVSELRSFWHKIVLVGRWQAERYIRVFGVPPGQIAVMRNAIAPAFETSAQRRPYFFEAGRPPILSYTSTPFRGLDVLQQAFPLIRSLVPGCEARVYSAMSVYQVMPSQDPYSDLYQRCRATKGMAYIGAVGQSALAEAMRDADVFAYPSTFPKPRASR